MKLPTLLLLTALIASIFLMGSLFELWGMSVVWLEL